ncbi:ABC transporter substrate-binding protein [Microbacterium marinilacus]|uniref:ABC transporter substrate-binding protein n=1 Tax=Microbacterium marinilacus TaxID=415209 RepID=A0ABP7BQ36_9MICO|nr:ABC transporter substrate-binding protein [Microbacterium marinilacus]MBY0690498.1 ABC transporter substrate-binding protein [Microbacterium marinilacus]
MNARPLALAVLVVGASALTACAPFDAADGTVGDAPSAVTIALPAEPPGTDPILTRSIAAWNIYYALYDGLTRIDRSGEVVPGLATEWEADETLTEWTFHLREGVVFHDGSTLTPADVVGTYRAILGDESSTNRAAISMLEAVEEGADGASVVFTLRNPYSAWASMVATIGVVPEAAYAEAGGSFADAPVGTGPYSFVSSTSGVDYRLTRNDDYWGEAPAVQDVTFSYVSSEDARLTGVQSGSLDIALVPPNQVAGLESSTRASVITEAGNQVVFLGTTPAGPLADPALRRAISLAVDREALADSLLSGLAEPANQLVAPGVTGYVDDLSAPETDVDEAKALVAASGYDGSPITLEYASTGGVPMASEVAQAVAGALAEVGLTVELVGSDQPSFSLKLANSEIGGLYLNGWSPSVMDGDVVVNQILAGGPEDYYDDAEMAELYLEQQASEGEERLEVYERIWELNDELSYQIPLYVNSSSYAVDPAVEWVPAVDGIFRAADIVIAE